MTAERASLSDLTCADDLTVPIDKGPGKGDGAINVTALWRQCAQAAAEVARLRAALEEIARLPCQYPDDPRQDTKMALDSIKAQGLAREALNGGEAR